MVSKFVARQLSWPRGIAGWLTRTLMNRGNAGLNSFALEALASAPSDRVLEIGFGGGVLLERLIAQSGFVCGVDRSSDAVAAARRHHAAAVQAGRADFKLGTVESLPFPDAAFDKALSVHTVYFWNGLLVGSRELARILRPGGRVVLGFLPKEHMDRLDMPPEVFTPRTPDDILGALSDAGFASPELRRRDGSPWLVATALCP
jgi:SAM-dependent methyltransferase